MLKYLVTVNDPGNNSRVAESEVGLFVVLELALLPGLQEVLLQVEHLALVAHVHPSVPVLLTGGYVPARNGLVIKSRVVSKIQNKIARIQI